MRNLFLQASPGVLAPLLLCCVLMNSQPAAIGTVKNPLGVTFVNVAGKAGITGKTVYGDEHKNRYLLETTGSGAAFIDYDNDGLEDIFLVNGTRLDGVGGGQQPTNRLYHNNGNGTFTDVTSKAGLIRSGWGQSVCVGDFDNDGFDDLFISGFGKNALYHNNGNGTFTDVAEKAGVANNATRWGSGSAFVDYDRDGYLDLFVASYIDLDLKSAPLPETGPCLYKGVMVACGPPGLTGGVNTLYHNNGNGTFTDVSEKAGIRKTNGTYSLGVLVADFDNDGWPDIYVANDSAPAALYHNNQNGTFTDIAVEAGCAFSVDGKPQAGMGVTAGDYDRDGWLDIFLVNGHVYPEVERLTTEAGYAQRKVLYRNLHNGHFADVSEEVGGAVMSPTPSRGCAFGDYDNDGLMDILINPVNAAPELLHAESANQNSWIKIKTIGTKSNRDGIGA